MNTIQTKKRKKPLIITKPLEAILRAIHFYRYVTALDMAHLLYSPSSLTYVRGTLSSLAGGADFKPAQYLLRFPLPTMSIGGATRIFTLGSKGRDFLAKDLGLSVDWYFRPYKLKHLSYSQVLHALALTRTLIAGSAWAAQHPDFSLAQTRTCYELVRTPATVSLTNKREEEKLKVIPDAWLLFEQKGGEHGYPVLLELDRGMEYREKFKRHVRSRLEFIKKGGAYSKIFNTDAVVIAYMTTGDMPEYRETRRRAMCAWTMEVLTDLHKEAWASLFRFNSFLLDHVYDTHIFEAPVWYRPDSSTPVPLFTP